MPDFGTPSTDVKVAGRPATAASTTVLYPPRDEWSRDEVTDVDGPPPGGRRSAALPKIAVVAAVATLVVGGGAVAAFALTGGSDEGKTTNAAVIPSKPVPAPAQADPVSDPATAQTEAAALRRQLLDRASQAARKDSGKHPALGAKGSPLPSATTSGSGGGGSGGGDPVPAGAAQQIAKKLMVVSPYNFTGSGEFGCLVNLWNKESHWNTHASNPSGAYGIPQSLPGSKMASAGPDWQNNATTQIKWGLNYVQSRYGTPCGAWGHSQSTGWY